jgi:hypothetical protein
VEPSSHRRCTVGAIYCRAWQLLAQGVACGATGVPGQALRYRARLAQASERKATTADQFELIDSGGVPKVIFLGLPGRPTDIAPRWLRQSARILRL